MTPVPNSTVGVVIRETLPDDLDRVVELAAEWARSGETPGEDGEDRQWLADRIGPYLLVSEVEGDLMGYVVGEAAVSGPDVRSVLPEGTPFLEVSALYVRPERRGQGLGGHLFGEVALCRSRRRPRSGHALYGCGGHRRGSALLPAARLQAVGDSDDPVEESFLSTDLGDHPKSSTKVEVKIGRGSLSVLSAGEPGY